MPTPQGEQDEWNSSTLGNVRAKLARARAERDEALRALDAARQRETALEAELLQRVRNALAVVRSIFSRTVENAETLEDAADHFRGRLDTLAQYQLRTTVSDGYYFEDMLRDTLITFAINEDSRIDIAGPEVRLDGRTAESVGLALHELATNSIKFGMLSPGCEAGTLDLHWSVTDDLLSFEWLEKGVAIVSSAPLRSGFGREYIEQALLYQIGAETLFELAAGSVRCTMAVPLTHDSNFVGRELSVPVGVDMG
jgi:two-component sensor histidine kinase